LPSIKHVWIEIVPVADVRNRLFFDQMQAEKPDFFLTFSSGENFLRLFAMFISFL
jgi:hypothetical protein